MKREPKTIEQAASAAKPVFDRHGWTYWHSNEPPSEDVLANAIRELLSYVVKGDAEYSSSGRFVVLPPNDLHGYRICLVLSEIETDDAIVAQLKSKVTT